MAGQNEYFSEAFKIVKEIQESRLVKMGFMKKYHPQMALFALKNVAGWRDKQPDKDDNFEALKKISEFIGDMKKEKSECGEGCKCRGSE